MLENLEAALDVYDGGARARDQSLRRAVLADDRRDGPGSGTWTWRSKRPGRMRASSRDSGKLVALDRRRRSGSAAMLCCSQERKDVRYNYDVLVRREAVKLGQKLVERLTLGSIGATAARGRRSLQDGAWH